MAWRSNPLDHVVPNSSALSQEELSREKFSCFTFGSFHRQSGTTDLRIDADGKGTLDLWQDTDLARERLQATFTLEPQELDELCRQLRNVKFAELNDEYNANAAKSIVDATFISDDESIAISVGCGEVTKQVVCLGNYPPAIVTLTNYIDQEILPRHKKAIDEAKPVEQEEGFSFQGSTVK
ncbi:hypothetical protein LOC68_03445 [Blastopirellula sp. JC732]|uniref:Uncharacterized protein n=1 Tax=Blastopirellula sediminis TaxID=2894196 RepID=A0A9X1MIK7_9BACT|nr:hypothetical protein [Blastopirellula sediminis]MCC9607766.1 hypothetical protein [Blastopirellula sediminis]MCC9627441.1 hypothetical protein [Blastopirellula sediminis]